MTIEEIEKQANPGQFSSEDIRVFVPEIEKLQPKDIYLEIGVERGRSLSIARMVSDPEVVVCGVDILSDPKVPNTTFTQGDSVEVAKNAIFLMFPHMEQINVLFIDGDHTYQGCKNDIEAWFPFMKKGGVMLFHDCDETSPGVMWAVSEFVYNHHKEIAEFKLCKRTDRNTSMALIRLC